MWIARTNSRKWLSTTFRTIRAEITLVSLEPVATVTFPRIRNLLIPQIKITAFGTPHLVLTPVIPISSRLPVNSISTAAPAFLPDASISAPPNIQIISGQSPRRGRINWRASPACRCCSCSMVALRLIPMGLPFPITGDNSAARRAFSVTQARQSRPLLHLNLEHTPLN